MTTDDLHKVTVLLKSGETVTGWVTLEDLAKLREAGLVVDLDNN